MINSNGDSALKGVFQTREHYCPPIYYLAFLLAPFLTPSSGEQYHRLRGASLMPSLDCSTDDRRARGSRCASLFGTNCGLVLRSRDGRRAGNPVILRSLEQRVACCCALGFAVEQGIIMCSDIWSKVWGVAAL